MSYSPPEKHLMSKRRPSHETPSCLMICDRSTGCPLWSTCRLSHDVPYHWQVVSKIACSTPSELAHFNTDNSTQTVRRFIHMYDAVLFLYSAISCHPSYAANHTAQDQSVNATQAMPAISPPFRISSPCLSHSFKCNIAQHLR